MTDTPIARDAPITMPPRPPKVIVAVRTGLYMVLSTLWLVVAGILSAPVLLLPKGRGWFAFRIWARVNLFLLEISTGQRMRVLGRENIPTGGALIASKHMSAWETFALIPLLPRTVYILKKELLKIPLWGQYARHFGMIAIDRAGGASTLAAMAEAAEAAIADGAQVVIFPEGTRRPAGAPPDYKPGVALLYRKLNVPLTPVALDSGLFAPAGSRLRYPGTVTVSFLPPLPGDLPRKEFQAALEDAIETETNRLLAAQGKTA